MDLLNDYQNSLGDGSDGGGNASDPSTSRKRRSELERQIVITDSDLKRVLREKGEIEIRQRKYKKEEERIRVDREVLGKQLVKISEEERLLREELSVLKKKLKTLV